MGRRKKLRLKNGDVMRNAAKLLPEQVRQIRHCVKHGYSYEYMADVFECTAQNIHSIAKRKSWRALR